MKRNDRRTPVALNAKSHTRGKPNDIEFPRDVSLIPQNRIEKEYKMLCKKYRRLQTQLNKIIRIGDINQNKLLTANEKIAQINAQLKEKEKILQLELSRAAKYVTSIVPPPVTLGPIQTQWRFYPCKELGGDSFGYHWIDDDHFAFYLLDVCDHGVGPALLSVSVLNLIRTQSLPDTDFKSPEFVLAELNQRFQMQDNDNLYFTLWYGVYNRRSHRLTYAGAGHPPALLKTGAGEIMELRTPNLFIGGRKDTAYSSASIKVPPPAEIYVFSDGVFEVTLPGDKLWSLKELKEFLFNSPAGTDPVIDRLYPYLLDIHGEPLLDDDFSILRIQFR
jgi:sigma-B regulation protein RsbU (phosphoserine phosphatase)